MNRRLLRNAAWLLSTGLAVFTIVSGGLAVGAIALALHAPRFVAGVFAAAFVICLPSWVSALDDLARRPSA